MPMTTKKETQTHEEHVETVVKKEKKQTTNNARDHFVESLSNFERQDRIHQIIGVIFLVIALWILRVQLVGFVLLILGILFFTGYFEKDSDKDTK